MLSRLKKKLSAQCILQGPSKSSGTSHLTPAVLTAQHIFFPCSGDITPSSLGNLTLSCSKCELEVSFSLIACCLLVHDSNCPNISLSTTVVNPDVHQNPSPSSPRILLIATSRGLSFLIGDEAVRMKPRASQSSGSSLTEKPAGKTKLAYRKEQR